MLNSVYMVQDDDNDAPPERVMKVSFFAGGYVKGTDDFMEPTIHFAIGEYDEGTYEDSFKSSQAQTFSVTLDDLFRALGGIGAIDRIEPGERVERP